jgi:uncharacterized RDD family membrane protein YckC
MRFDETITIATPEGVDLELTLAGAGSRFVSALVDLGLQTALLIAVFLAAGLLTTGATPEQQGLAAAAYALISFLVVFGYDVLFEVLAAGRTPGKRLNGLRVVRSAGEPVGFVTSAIRNALRLVDFLPFAYVLGAGTILATRKNQRLGDIAAGTLVVRDRRDAPAAAALPSSLSIAESASWDTSAVTAEEIAAVRRFLERRTAIEDRARTELAQTLASRLLPKVGGVPAGLSAERFLALLVAAKAGRGTTAAGGPTR